MKKQPHICEDCKGTGKTIMWEGHGGNEREVLGKEPCEFCNGTGEIHPEDFERALDKSVEADIAFQEHGE